jgi:hypothetical protein
MLLKCLFFCCSKRQVRVRKCTRSFERVAVANNRAVINPAAIGQRHCWVVYGSVLGVWLFEYARTHWPPKIKSEKMPKIDTGKQIKDFLLLWSARHTWQMILPIFSPLCFWNFRPLYWLIKGLQFSGTLWLWNDNTAANSALYKLFDIFNGRPKFV